MNIFPAAGLTTLLAIQPVLAGAVTPGAQIRDSIDKILVIVNDPRLKTDSKERRERIKAVIHARIDDTEMAKRSLGPEWRRRSPEEQKELVKLFTELIESSYLATIESVEKVRFLKEQVDGNYAEVKTQVIDNKGLESAVDYRLHNVNGDWKVYDVVVDNLSLVNNYRTQFSRVLASYSYAELIRRMKATALNAAGELQAFR